MQIKKYDLKCQMQNDCKDKPSYIDVKGFIYCEHHGKQRKLTHSCRKLSTHEVKELTAGKPLSRF
jgi:hypothetical protein